MLQVGNYASVHKLEMRYVSNDFLGGNACINVLGPCHNWIDRQQKCINDHFLEMDDFLETVN